MTTAKKLCYHAFALLGTTLLLCGSCKKEHEKNVPVLSTAEVTGITSKTAMSGGNISDDRGAIVTSRGVCWSTSHNPTITDSKTDDGDGAGSFTSTISGLEPNTNYYLRAYATNSSGTGYGSTMSFKTLRGAVDADGYVYYTVIIGGQEWFAENLRTTRYNDGTPILNVTDNSDWSNPSSGAYCWYDNDPANGNTYGALYNAYTVRTGKLCPTGWHVATDAEWTELTDYLGGKSVAGGKLKEAGTVHWDSPNTGATNETGFTALPGGYRDHQGTFKGIGYLGGWWSAPGGGPNICWYWGMRSHHEMMVRTSFSEITGYSVRCVRDK